MTHYIRALEDELAQLIDSLGPVDGMAKTTEWYAWRDRLMNFVVKKVYESYRNGREGITDANEAGATADDTKKVEPNEAPAGHGSRIHGTHRDYPPRGEAVHSQGRQPARRYPENRAARGRADRR
jgi:hypothetical protein